MPHGTSSNARRSTRASRTMPPSKLTTPSSSASAPNMAAKPVFGAVSPSARHDPDNTPSPASPWQGRRLDLVRYSGRQEAAVEMRGVAGHLDLPAGPGG